MANAGKIDPNFPDTAQAYLGRRLLLHRRPDTQSLRTEFRQAVASSLEAYFDFSYEKSSRDENAALFSSNTFVTVPVGIPTNPFGQEVRVRFPYEATAPHESSRLHRSMTGGLLFSLPSDWSARLEHTRTYNRSVDRAQTGDFERLKAAINAGTLNVFRRRNTAHPRHAGAAADRAHHRGVFKLRPSRRPILGRGTARFLRSRRLHCRPQRLAFDPQQSGAADGCGRSWRRFGANRGALREKSLRHYL